MNYGVLSLGCGNHLKIMALYTPHHSKNPPSLKKRFFSKKPENRTFRRQQKDREVLEEGGGSYYDKPSVYPSDVACIVHCGVQYLCAEMEGSDFRFPAGFGICRINLITECTACKQFKAQKGTF